MPTRTIYILNIILKILVTEKSSEKERKAIQIGKKEKSMFLFAIM